MKTCKTNSKKRFWCIRNFGRAEGAAFLALPLILKFVMNKKDFYLIYDFFPVLDKYALCRCLRQAAALQVEEAFGGIL